MTNQLLAHKIEMRPSPSQQEYLNQCIGASRHLFNQLLAHFSNKDENGEAIKWNKKDARQKFYALRNVKFPWYGDISAAILQSTIDDLDTAFKNFFRRVKQGGKPGFPRFKKRGKNDTFGIRESKKFRISGHGLVFERFNTGRHGVPLKLRERVRFQGTHKQMNVSKRAGKFYVSVLVDTSTYNDHSSIITQGNIGVDFGIKDLAVCNDGTIFEATKAMTRSANKLAKLQRGQKRKLKTSNRYAKAKRRIARLHKRVADQRSAALHRVSDYVTKHFDHIAIEDLNVKGMVKNRKLSRVISDVGFFELRRQIEYKAKLRNREVTIVDRWFPSSKLCSSCGVKNNDLTLSDRSWKCVCGAVHDRDMNAAMNISGQIKARIETSQSSDSNRCLTAPLSR